MIQLRPCDAVGEINALCGRQPDAARVVAVDIVAAESGEIGVVGGPGRGGFTLRVKEHRPAHGHYNDRPVRKALDSAKVTIYKRRGQIGHRGAIPAIQTALGAGSSEPHDATSAWFRLVDGADIHHCLNRLLTQPADTPVHG